jgi:hypothetical protein
LLLLLLLLRQTIASEADHVLLLFLPLLLWYDILPRCDCAPRLLLILSCYVSLCSWTFGRPAVIFTTIGKVAGLRCMECDLISVTIQSLVPSVISNSCRLLRLTCAACKHGLEEGKARGRRACVRTTTSCNAEHLRC